MRLEKRVSRGVATALLVTVSAAHAAPITLTAAGIAQGLSLTTFASGFASTSGIGPISYVNVPASSRVLVSDYAGNHIYSFATNTDGQSVGAATPSTQIYGAATGLAVLNGKVYAADQGGGAISQVDAYGNVASFTAWVPSATGLAASSMTGLLYASGSSGLSSINPTTGAVTVLHSGGYDGLSVTSDGSELFAEDGGHVYGYNLTSGAQIFDSGAISGADGALVADLAGTPVLFVNTNYGQIWEVNLGDAAQLLIADGGSRGDIAALDTSNNTAIFSQTSSLVRLSLPAGSTFGGAAVPEPASLALLGIGLLGIARARRRR